jgi:phosphoribosylformylglycinamidine cyclo-ligase
MNNKRIGQVIFEQRRKLNLTRSELAKQFHVTSKEVSRWENGGIPNLELLKELSNYFQIDFQELLYDQVKEEEKSFSKMWVACVFILFLLFLGIWWLFPKQDTFHFPM